MMPIYVGNHRHGNCHGIILLVQRPGCVLGSLGLLVRISHDFCVRNLDCRAADVAFSPHRRVTWGSTLDDHQPIERQLSQLLTRGSARRREGRDSEGNATEHMSEWQFSWRLIFTWQCPMMFIGYSTLFYFIGLTVVVCSPLIYGKPWGPEIWVSVHCFKLADIGLTGVSGCDDIPDSLRSLMGTLCVLLTGWVPSYFSKR